MGWTGFPPCVPREFANYARRAQSRCHCSTSKIWRKLLRNIFRMSDWLSVVIRRWRNNVRASETSCSRRPKINSNRFDSRRNARAIRFAANKQISLRVGKVIGKHKMAKHFDLTITEDSFTYTRNEERIGEEAALDGLYVVRSSVDKKQMDSERVVETYKSLAKVERAFRCMKTVDLSLRPIYHRNEDRIRSHVFICMLAYYVEWHMREKLRPVLFADDDQESAAAARKSIVSPAQRSASAKRKDATRRTCRQLSSAEFPRHPEGPWHALPQPHSDPRI